MAEVRRGGSRVPALAHEPPTTPICGTAETELAQHSIPLAVVRTEADKLLGGGVPAKLKLQELLGLTPLPVLLLREFCCGYKVPDQCRQLVWKLLLDIIPKDAKTCDDVKKQQAGQYWSALKVIFALTLPSIEWQTLPEFQETTRKQFGFSRYISKLKKMTDFSRVYGEKDEPRWVENAASFVSLPRNCGGDRGRHTRRMKASLEQKLQAVATTPPPLVCHPTTEGGPAFFNNLVGIPATKTVGGRIDAADLIRSPTSPADSIHSAFAFDDTSSFSTESQDPSELDCRMSKLSLDVSSLLGTSINSSANSYLISPKVNNIPSMGSSSIASLRLNIPPSIGSSSIALPKLNIPAYMGNSSIPTSPQVARSLSNAGITPNVPRILSRADLSALNPPENINLDAKVFGVYTLMNHPIGYISSGTYRNSELDYDAERKASVEDIVPSVVDTMFIWMVNRGSISVGTLFSQIEYTVDHAAYLAVGRHLSCDCVVDTYTLRLAVWDLISRRQDALVDAVVVTGRQMMLAGERSSYPLHQRLEAVHFFSSGYLPFLALSLFSNLLSSVAAEKVLDKILAECFSYLGYLLVELLLQARPSLLGVETSQEAVTALVGLSIHETDGAVNSSLELWHKHNTVQQ